MMIAYAYFNIAASNNDNDYDAILLRDLAKLPPEPIEKAKELLKKNIKKQNNRSKKSEKN